MFTRAFGLKFWAIISGGGALPGPLEKFWNALGFVVVQGYGMTETTALITLNHPFHVAQGTIGKPLAGREVKLGAGWRGAGAGRGHLRRNLVGRAHCIAREDEWLATGDLAERRALRRVALSGAQERGDRDRGGREPAPRGSGSGHRAGAGRGGLRGGGDGDGRRAGALRGAGHARDGRQGGGGHRTRQPRLAEFQRLRRWVLWPEPDLPRTSTGKVRRKAVAAWLERIQAAAATADNGTARQPRQGAFGAVADWLLALIAQITGEDHPGVGDELRLTEDLHLDSLGRVQLAAAIEERLGIVSEDGLLDRVQTLGELRRLVAGEENGEPASSSSAPETEEKRKDGARGESAQSPTLPQEAAERMGHPAKKRRPSLRGRGISTRSGPG